MLNFNFYNPTRIYFGKGRVDKLAGYIPAGARVLITYGGGSAKRSGLIDRIREVLAGHEVFEFGGIEPNPRYETLLRAVEVVRENKVDFMLAVGGGSVIDGTKFVALAAHYDGEPTDLLKFGFKPITPPVVQQAVPFGVVLTLPATGSEMNMGAVVTYEHSKYSVMSPLTFPTVLGARSDALVHASRDAGGQRRGGCVRARHRAVSDLPGGRADPGQDRRERAPDPRRGRARRRWPSPRTTWPGPTRNGAPRWRCPASSAPGCRRTGRLT